MGVEVFDLLETSTYQKIIAIRMYMCDRQKKTEGFQALVGKCTISRTIAAAGQRNLIKNKMLRSAVRMPLTEVRN